jgi:nucleoside-diphosphate-sugar epimerase
VATPNTILIAGATGLVGAAAVEHFAALPGWRVVALSRRRPPLPAGARHLALDLTDGRACTAAGGALAEVTHVLFAALYEKPDLVAGWRDPEQMAVNEAMLKNLLDALEPAARGLRHVSLLQGTKAYGAHIEPARVPAKERWPRHRHENFYWLQEDLLRERQRGRSWSFTILRPQAVFGHAVGSPMNVVAAIGAYAAILREEGRALAFPGGGPAVNGASDSRLIARAAAFAATSPVAAGETYNVVNGDVLVWRDVWPAVAAHFRMPAGEPAPLRLAEAMPPREDIWARIVAKHHLAPHTLDSLVGSSWQFADRSFATGSANPPNSVLSPIKLRRAGFHDCEDTEDSLLYWLRRMQAEKLLPA